MLCLSRQCCLQKNDKATKLTMYPYICFFFTFDLCVPVTSVSLFFYKNMRKCGETRRTYFEDRTTLPGFPKKRNNAKINIPNQLLPVEVYNQQRLPRRKMYIASSRTRRNDFNAEFNENIEGALVTVARAAFQGTVDPHCFRGMPAVLSKPLERLFFRSCCCNVILCVD